LELAEARSFVQLQKKIVRGTRIVGSKFEIVYFRDINEALDTDDF